MDLEGQFLFKFFYIKFDIYIVISLKLLLILDSEINFIKYSLFLSKMSSIDKQS